jgi:hypothetical protein
MNRCSSSSALEIHHVSHVAPALAKDAAVPTRVVAVFIPVAEVPLGETNYLVFVESMAG